MIERGVMSRTIEVLYDDHDSVFNVVHKITAQIREDEENFIYENVSPYLCDYFKAVIPKELLTRAIVCFAVEHKEEYDAIMERARAKELFPESEDEECI